MIDRENTNPALLVALASRDPSLRSVVDIREGQPTVASVAIEGDTLDPDLVGAVTAEIDDPNQLHESVISVERGLDRTGKNHVAVRYLGGRAVGIAVHLLAKAS